MGTGVTLTAHELREFRALLGLKGKAGLGDRGIKKLVEVHGSGFRALKAVGGQIDLLEEVSPGTGLSASPRQDGGGVPMTSPRYPPSLTQLVDPPPVLFWEGRFELLTRPAVAIVGSRRASGVGRRAAETMGRVLAEAGVVVVSGMALGIDGAAHRGALEGGGDTVAVLGSGLQVIYPSSHRSLFREIRTRGAVVSEFLPRERAQPHHFPKRNRIIAALSRAVVVVEAGRRSGALITVDHALDLGRDILVTPGSVENPQSVGSNALLKDGARPISDPARILQDLEGIGFDVGEKGNSPGPAPDLGLEIPSDLHGVWAVLSLEPLGVAEVADKAHVSIPHALGCLSALELGGWVSPCPGMRFRRSPRSHIRAPAHGTAGG